MRILFAIPHYVRPGGQADPGRSYGSLQANPGRRVRALADSIAALHQQFNDGYCVLQHGLRQAHRTQPSPPTSIDIVICTTGGCHVLDELAIEPRYYTHRPTTAEPLLLGFACHDVLRERLGGYDFYCYLEDDLVLHDPWFFHKLTWFNSIAGNDKLLQPNRYEAGLNYLTPKLYLDGDLDHKVTAVFQNVEDSPPLKGNVLGVTVRFLRTLNPHSGCFFLSAEQMAHWARQRHFNDRASRFIGPLETCATLGIVRTFRVYRPCPTCADFLEIQHHGTSYLQRLCEPPGLPARESAAASTSSSDANTGDSSTNGSA